MCDNYRTRSQPFLGHNDDDDDDKIKCVSYDEDYDIPCSQFKDQDLFVHKMDAKDVENIPCSQYYVKY